MRDRSLLSTKQIASRDRLIFALDLPSSDVALRLVEKLGDAISFYKLGLQLFMNDGYFPLVEQLPRLNKKIFVDLKFFDVPETVRNAVENLSHRGVECCTVHGSQAMLEAGVLAKGTMKLLAVTGLHSLERGDLQDLGFACNVEDLVFSRARPAPRLRLGGGISTW